MNIDWTQAHEDHTRRGRLAFETYARETGSETAWEQLDQRDQVAWYKAAGVVVSEALSGCADAYEKAHLAPGWVQELRTAAEDAVCHKLSFAPSPVAAGPRSFATRTNTGIVQTGDGSTAWQGSPRSTKDS